MGSDYYTKLILGVEVTREDFWQRGGVKKPGHCSRGHKVTLKQKFCPECGEAAQEKDFEVPSPILLELTKLWNEEDGSEWEPGVVYEAMVIDTSDEDLTLFPCRNLDDSETGGRVKGMILGRELCSFGSNDGPQRDKTLAYSHAELSDLFAEVRVQTEQIGLGDREVYLIPVLYCSV